MELAEDGPKFKETDPNETLPEGMKVPGGGLVVPEDASGRLR